MKRAFLPALGFALLSLTACEGVKEELGLTKQSPDEFKVVSRAPLTLPPDYSLRPPEPGARPTGQATTSDKARQVLLEGSAAKAGAIGDGSAPGRSASEASLLRAAGAGQSQSGIRAVVDRETLDINEADQRFIDKLVFWRDPEAPGVVIDADKEARRLKENAALGKSATAGETPTIERRRKALLEDVF